MSGYDVGFAVGQVIGGVAFWVVLAGLYLLPAIVAWGRRARARGWITALTVLLGWTGVAWVAALVWACAGARRP